MTEAYTCDGCGEVIGDGYTIEWKRDLPESPHSISTRPRRHVHHLCVDCWPGEQSVRGKMRSILRRLGMDDGLVEAMFT